MELLNEDLMVLDADVSTSEDVIRLAAGLFFEHGYVKDGYGDAVVEREKEFPTGLPGKAMNIAIPHTNNKLVNAPAVGVVIPKEPVKFAMMGDKSTILDCELMFPLVVKDTQQQIGMLKKMMKIIQNSELLQQIKNSKDKSEIKELLKTLEEE